MKELYETILARLEAKVTEFEMIDLEMGQLEVMALDQRPGVLFPCALIDISYPQCEDENENIQLVTARANIRMAFECPNPTDNKASDARRAAALAIFATVDKVFKNFQGYSTADFGAFSRKSQTTDNRFAGIKIINMSFEVNFEESVA